MLRRMDIATGCCVAGGGPAGVMLGFLLARAGIDVVVLEKHDDFLRDFRGDTIHPATLQVMHELGMLDEFRSLLQSEITTLDLVVGGRRFTPVDFSTLAPPGNFLGMVPQWDFLSFVSAKATQYPGFTLLLSTEATELTYSGDRVSGVVARGPSGSVRISADLVVAADGRSSMMRTAAGLPVREVGIPIDALWFRIGKLSPEPPPTLAYIGGNGMVLTIDRGDYYQAGMYVAKGSFDQIKSDGIERFRARILGIAPVLAGVVNAIVSWDQVKLLTVQVNNMPRWHRPGLLCIGDAAHAMSPAFGVGINYAVQDAIAAANILAPALRERVVSSDHLAAVQRRREYPTRMMQRAQVLLHQRISRPNPGRAVPALIGATAPIIEPVLQRIAARFVGLGLRPEHISC